MSTAVPEFSALGEVAERGPRQATIEPTDRCNTRCLHCTHYHSDFGEDMAEPLVRKALDALVGGLESVTAQAHGEPLMADAFYSILAACEQRGVPVFFATNGILLRDEALVRRLVRAKAGVVVSIDGARPETFGFVRPALRWDRMLETLALVRRCAEEAGPDRRGRLWFLCVAMKDTIGDLPDLVRMAKEYGAGHVQVHALLGEGVEKLRGQGPFGAPDVVAPACLEALAVAWETGVGLGLPPSFLSMIRDRAAGGAAWVDGLSKGARCVLSDLLADGESAAEAANDGPKTGIRPCALPWESTLVKANGKVHACCMGGPALGDLNTQEWDAIWNGPLIRSFRRTVHSWNPPGICRTCVQNDGIHGGDSTKHWRYFAEFRAQPVALDAPGVRFGEGFGATETVAGNASAWRLAVGPGVLSLPMCAGARFLRLSIEASHYDEFTPGRCAINDGPSEPFDTSAGQLHFPLDHVEAERLEARFETEPGLGRGLVVQGIEFLS